MFKSFSFAYRLNQILSNAFCLFNINENICKEILMLNKCQHSDAEIELGGVHHGIGGFKLIHLNTSRAAYA